MNRILETLLRRSRQPDLIYAATSRCPCGHGLAYPSDRSQPGGGPGGYWDCAGIILGTADLRVQHTAQLPFVFWEVKGEGQPSGRGATTRPV